MHSIMPILFVAALTMFSSTVFRSIGLAAIFNEDAMMIVGGGTILALFLGFPAGRLKKTFIDVVDSFRPLKDRQELAREMLSLARTSRRADIRQMERRILTLKDEFLRLGMNLLISHRNKQEIRSIMEREMAIRVMDFRFSLNVLKAAARLTPSFGLAGTVISLIKIFKASQSIENIAPLMAVAMMSTFYGVVLSNLFMLPLCAKLEERAVQSEALMYGIMEGIEAMSDLQNPLHIEEQVSGNYEGDVPVHAKIDADFVAAGTGPRLHAA